MALTILLFLVALCYAILILAFTAGWFRLPVFWHKNGSNIPFTVIIPARNEEKTIMQLLVLMRKQHYPKDLYEVIVVDDHSTDSTAAIVERKIKSGFFSNVKLVRASEERLTPGKKNALAAGILRARHEWIVTTDADCLLGSHWLESLAGFIEKEKPAMVIGPVVIVPGKTLLSQMQALEFLSLTGSTAGAAAIGRPVMCNGANLAFRKDFFERVGGYAGNEYLASGDDVFLLHKFKKMKGTKVAFLKSHGAIVHTRALDSLSSFFRQRGRWAGKAGGFRDWFTLMTGGVVMLINILIFLGLLAGPFISQKLMLSALLLLTFKAVVDFPMLYWVSGFFQKRDLMWLYPALALVYPFYVVVSLFSGFVLKPRWKS